MQVPSNGFQMFFFFQFPTFFFHLKNPDLLDLGVSEEMSHVVLIYSSQKNHDIITDSHSVPVHFQSGIAFIKYFKTSPTMIGYKMLPLVEYGHFQYTKPSFCREAIQNNKS